MRASTRRIWLCADDYGIAPGVNRGIRQLILDGRLNATSVMMAAPHIDADEVDALTMLNSGKTRVAIGLHVTLTGQFRPLSAGFAPLRNGVFLSNAQLAARAVARRLDAGVFAIEIATQMQAFVDAFGRLPDFVDGHQHVQLLPTVRDAFLKVVAEIAPRAWVRQCGRVAGARRLRDPKVLAIDVLNLGFRAKAAQLGLVTNPAFAGAYAFRPDADFAAIFPPFLDGLPDGGLVMCHPGFVDAALKSLDSLTDLRERELAYFASEAFPRDLARRGVALADPAGETGPAA